MLVNICMKFHEDTSNGFQVTVRKRFCEGQSSKGLTRKVKIQELWFLHCAHRLMLVNICMKFHEDTLNGFQVIERKRFCDRQTETDRQITRAKTICLPTLKGGDIIAAIILNFAQCGFTMQVCIQKIKTEWQTDPDHTA